MLYRVKLIMNVYIVIICLSHILEVWGTDGGVFSGQNAFGGTVQEVGIAAQYMTDKTTNYQT